MRNSIFVIFLALLLVACQTIPENVFVLSPVSLQQRQLETRKYEGIAEEELITASNNVLQDLGFNLENSEVKLGVLTANKQRDASNAGEIVGAVIVAVLTGAIMPVSKDQTIRVCLVVRPSLNDKREVVPNTHFVRVTFQRIVRLTDNSVRSETIKEVELYEQFFERLSKSIFIEAQKV